LLTSTKKDRKFAAAAGQRRALGSEAQTQHAAV
jgi:hypothetical protein